jgi:hypothetical protein
MLASIIRVPGKGKKQRLRCISAGKWFNADDAAEREYPGESRRPSTASGKNSPRRTHGHLAQNAPTDLSEAFFKAFKGTLIHKRLSMLIENKVGLSYERGSPGCGNRLGPLATGITCRRWYAVVSCGANGSHRLIWMPPCVQDDN